MESSDEWESVVTKSSQGQAEAAHSDFFYRQLAIHLAERDARPFRVNAQPSNGSALSAVQDFLRHESMAGRINPNDIKSRGEGFRVEASVSSCQYAGTCKGNLRALGEVPQCMRAISLIQAIDAKVPARPPMTYDLAPGLVDETSDACEIRLRPAGVPTTEWQQMAR